MTWTETSRTTTEAKRDVHRRVILIGPPGAGKGTQAHTLATQLGVAHISTGDLFRRHVGSRTVLGDRLKRSWSGGELVADKITLETVRDCLTEGNAAGDFLLDGFPCTVEQAMFLQQLLRQSRTDIRRSWKCTSARTKSCVTSVGERAGNAVAVSTSSSIRPTWKARAMRAAARWPAISAVGTADHSGHS
ncbi:adenylate kinase family protein [Saccharopolyspora hattusasensis]|uniref:adenylate kinase family protein n=1 Tax=Saccharopolyspora hattusasensis TaxID=1128679 RepID=UPI003D99E189